MDYGTTQTSHPAPAPGTDTKTLTELMVYDTKVLAALMVYTIALVTTGFNAGDGPWWLAAHLSVLILGSMAWAWMRQRGGRIPRTFRAMYMCVVALTGLFGAGAMLHLLALQAG